MKLRNKKTGEIGELITENYEFDGFWVRTGGDNYPDYKDINYYSLAELNEEWEDAPEEEPKEYWYIDSCGGALQEYFDGGCIDIQRKQIGNYFGTKEEAEKAVEKFKAWKRLKDKGFKITFVQDGGYVYLQADWGLLLGDFSDVELLFGGEE